MKVKSLFVKPGIGCVMCIAIFNGLVPLASGVEAKIQVVSQFDAGKTGFETLANSDRKNRKERKKAGQVSRVDEATETKVLTMVKSHVPELIPILDRLRTSRPESYGLAMRDLSKHLKKLATAKKRNEELYEIELRHFKARTKVNLLTAKLKVRDDQSDRDSLQVAVSEMLQAQVDRASYDVRLLERRLQSVKKQLAIVRTRFAVKQTNVDGQLENAVRRALKKAGRNDKE